jgi:hypothetical protein
MAAVSDWTLQPSTYCYFSQTFAYWQGDAESTLALVDLTGYSAALMIRQCPKGPVLVSLSSTGSALGSIVLGGTAGTVQVIMMPAATALLVGYPETVYDLILTSGSGLPEPFLEGDVLTAQTITHS